MILNKNYFVVYFLLFTSSLSYSQQEQSSVKDSTEIHDLKEVIVTATRTQRQLSSLPLPVQLISKKEISQVNSVRLNDILNEQTGLITIPDFGGGEGVQLQGMDSQYTLILIDGMPLIGRLAGTLDLNRITVGNIKQIEIVKGASSSLYGSEALGGVINIITDTPKTGFNGSINYRGGSFNSNDLSTTANFKNKRIALHTFINRYSSDGYDLNTTDVQQTVDPFSNYTFKAGLTYRLNPNTKLFLSGKYYLQNQDYVPSESLKGESTINEWNTHLKLQHDFNKKWRSFMELYATSYKADDYLNDPSGALFSTHYFDQLLVRPELRTTYKFNTRNSLIAGIGLNHETLDRTDFSQRPEFNAPYVYLQYDGYLNNALNIILGARFDSHNAYKSQLSPKAALRYKIDNDIALKASVGYGFKAPDFRQLYFDFSNSSAGYTVLGYNAVKTAIPRMQALGEINTVIVPLSEFDLALKPENSVSINFGVDFKLSTSLKLGINLFRNNINDLIDTRVIASKTNGQNVFSYYNLNKVYTQGVEINSSWKPNNHLKITGGYQLLYAKDKSAADQFKNGQVYARLSPNTGAVQLQKDDYFGLYNRSRHMANLKVFYSFPEQNLDANIRGSYRSKYGLYDSNNNNFLDVYDSFVSGYTIIDLAINKTFYKNYQMGFGIDNVFDFTDTQNISNIPGRIIYGKLNINF